MTTQQVVGWSCTALTPIFLGAFVYCLIKLAKDDEEDL